MRRKDISESMLVLVLSGILIVCFTACDTLGGSVGAGVYVETESTTSGGGYGQKSGPPDHAPAHGYRKKNTYHYYYDDQVYYDTSRGLYFYIEGSNWQVSASLPRRYDLDLGGYVTIEMETSQPQLYNKEHKGKYPRGYKKEKKKDKSKGKGKSQGKGHGYGHDYDGD